MKNNNKWIPALIISLGIIIGGYLDSAKATTVSVNSQMKKQNQGHYLLTIGEASKVLGITVPEMEVILHTEKSESETSEKMQYIYIDKKQYFTAASLLKWAENSMSQQRVYLGGRLFRSGDLP
ncbi:hypothetical protein ACFVHQ_18470 [Actinomycetes bacterium NPDC127524]